MPGFHGLERTEPAPPDKSSTIPRVRVLVVGSGGREHALVWRLGRDAGVTEVIAAPGNPGTAAVCRTLPLDPTRPADVLALSRRERVDLTVVGPEAPLERGLGDLFRAEGRPLLGPSRQGALLETSKVHAKQFMARHGIPTARFVVCDSADAALAAVAGDRFGFPVVVKADGLAAGKGVFVAETRAEAERAVRTCMIDRQFGAAGARLVIEACLTGPEVSFFVLCDGARAVPLGTAQDHKRISDGDRGPNTGGMGAFAPSPLLGSPLADLVMRRVVEPVLAGMRAEGDPYSGFLYVSLMLTDTGPQVIEFNVRFGDPEAQVLLPLLEGNFAGALSRAAAGDLTGAELRLGEDRLVGVVLASRGYPASSESGQPISGLEEAARVPGALVFHAGTRLDDGQIVTAGGRVLTVVGRGTTYEQAMSIAYDAVGRIRFAGMQYRRDIGQKTLTDDSRNART
jgi:phosphoribosylamine---glycine ligase